jgi:hypothetical protein
MAEVVFSLRNYVGFHEGEDAGLTETELAAILWENSYLFEGHSRMLGFVPWMTRGARISQ